MVPIQYFTGDATRGIRTSYMIAHVCNNQGKWGAGFTKAIDARHHLPGENYRRWAGGLTASGASGDFGLGEIQVVHIGHRLSSTLATDCRPEPAST